MANKPFGTLYIGVTNDLLRRVNEHKSQRNPNSFSAKYEIDMLVYYECYEDILPAIRREKQLKSGSRKNKINLIISKNPAWTDLYETIK